MPAVPQPWLCSALSSHVLWVGVGMSPYVPRSLWLPVLWINPSTVCPPVSQCLLSLSPAALKALWLPLHPLQHPWAVLLHRLAHFLASLREAQYC